MNIPIQVSRKQGSLLALLLLMAVLGMMVSGCSGSGSNVAPFGSVLSIEAFGNVVTSGSGTTATKTQMYRVSVIDSLAQPMNGIKVDITANFTSGDNIVVSGITASTGYPIFFSQETNKSGFFDFAIITTQLTGVQLPAPSPLVAPAVASGGTLTAGTYNYYVTALDNIGGQTDPALATATTTTPGSSVVLTWPAVAGASGYAIYAQGVYGGGSIGPGLLTTIPNTSATFTDTGAILPNTSIIPPVSNDTNAPNSVKGGLQAQTGSTSASTDVSL